MAERDAQQPEIAFSPPGIGARAAGAAQDVERAGADLLLVEAVGEAPEEPLDFDHMLGPEFEPEAVSPLAPGRGLLGYFGLLRELVRLGEAEFVVKLGVLGELASAEKTRWSLDELHNHFPWLQVAVRRRVFRGLRLAGWLEPAAAQSYTLTAQGENLFSLLTSLLGAVPVEGDLALGVLEVEVAHSIGADKEAPLLHLQHNLRRVIEEAEEALTTHSEVKILDVRRKLDRNLAWSIRARKLLDDLELDDFRSYKAAQSLGRSLSELHQWHGALQRALNDIARKSIRLDDSGLSLTDITQFLMRCDVEQIAGFGGRYVAEPPRPRFSIVDNVLTEAEYFFFLMERDPEVERRGWLDGEPEVAEEGTQDPERFAGLARFASDLERALGQFKRLGGANERTGAMDEAVPLAGLVPRGSWAESAYRLSLLCLADAGPESLPRVDEAGDSHLSVLRDNPIELVVTGRSVWVESEGVTEMSEGFLRPRSEQAGAAADPSVPLVDAEPDLDEWEGDDAGEGSLKESRAVVSPAVASPAATKVRRKG